MLVGELLLYDILLKRDIQALSYVKRKWLEPEEYETYHKIVEYVAEYEILPPVEEIFPSIPVGYVEGHPVAYWINKLRERYAQKLVLNLNARLKEGNAAENLMWFYNELSAFFTDYNSDYIVNEQGLVDFLLDVLNRARMNRILGINGYTTGWVALDNIIGGYQKSGLYVWVARLKTGKTYALLYSMHHLLQSHVKCMFISMEMSLDQIARRLLAIHSKSSVILDFKRIPSSFVDNEIKKLEWKLTFVNGAMIKRVSDVAALIETHRPNVVFVDGAYLIPARNFKAEWEKAKYIVEALKRVSLKKHTPIVCSYQLSRKASRKEDVDVDCIAFSDSIAQTAEAVIAITPTQLPEIRKVSVIANREGLTGEFNINFDFSKMNFDMLEEDKAQWETLEETEDLE